MTVLKELIKEMDTCIKNYPPETGGILGGVKGDVISHFIMDDIKEKPIAACSYSPNVEFLNQCIDDWYKNGIEFKGIFHTHFAGVKTLSKADEKYINEIMSVMPDTVKTLYFPIFVLPDRVLVPYKAEKNGIEISIVVDELKIQ